MAEADCIYVSSRGLLKSCTVHSAVPQSSCGTDTTYLDEWFMAVPVSMPPTTVYVCSELLSYFVEHLDLIKTEYILVSGDSDLTVPMEALTPDYYKKLVAHPLLIKWFAQNYAPAPALTYPFTTKVHMLPIGLDYHTLSNSGHNHPWGSRKTPLEQEKILVQIRNMVGAFIHRSSLIYSNVQYRLDRWGDRKKALMTIPRELLKLAPPNLTREETWRNMINYQFVLSPFGNGMDCHRTWEALMLGCIPICCYNKLEHHTHLPSYGLPVLYVNNWNEVTPALLKKAVLKYHLMSWNMDKLTLKYWQDVINRPQA